MSQFKIYHYFSKFVKNIFLFLNKEYDLNTFGSVLSILAQSISYTILISYIIYNLIVSITYNPNPENLLEINPDIHQVHSINIIWDFDEVLSEYMNFLASAVTLDFGNLSTEEERFSIILTHLLNTFIFLILGLLMSLLLSVGLIFLSSYSAIKNTLVFLTCKISYLHLAIILWITDDFLDIYFQFNINNASIFIIVLFSSFFVSLGSGILADYYTLLKEEYDTIMKKDYVIFAKDSGFNYYYFAFKELLFNLINISISRIPIIFGGLVIIEYYLKDSAMQGISYFIVDQLDGGDNTSIFVSVFICICIFTPIYFSSQFIQKNIIKK